MRFIFGIIRLVVVAALIQCPNQSVNASAVCIVMSQESTQFNETIEGFRKGLALCGLRTEIKIHILSRDGSQAHEVAQVLSQATATHLLALGSLAAQLAAQGNFGMPSSQV
jgi:ABC-type uncharacterized transport system substrate-binding protein